MNIFERMKHEKISSHIPSKIDKAALFAQRDDWFLMAYKLGDLSIRALMRLARKIAIIVFIGD